MNYFMATDLRTRLVYIVEHARGRSKKLKYSAMRAESGGDWRVAPRTVPLAIRRAAKQALGVSQ